MFGFALAPLLKPLLIGAGTGALGGLLTGKDPLKGALMGGVTGGLLGSVPALGAGGVGADAASVPLMSTSPMSSVNAFLEPSVQTSGIVGSTGELGANMGLVNPMTSAPSEMLASRIPNMGVDAFTQQPTMFDSLYDKVSPYMNVRDLTGAAQVASQYQDRPMPTPQSGRITEGRAPQGNDVMALLQTMKLPERRRISLI